MDRAASNSAWSTFVGILLILAGITAVIVPLVAGVTTDLFLAWLVLLAGVGHFVYAWSERGAGAAVWQILIGVVYVGAATYMFVMPVSGLIALTLLLAMYITIEGLLEFAVYASVRNLPGTSWFLIDAIVSFVLAGLIFLDWPTSSYWALGSLVGISLIMSGTARLIFPETRRRRLSMITGIVI